MNEINLPPNLSPEEAAEIKRLLSYSKNTPPTQEDIWKMMDLVWDEIGCNNRRLQWGKIAEYYRHPVWLLNGFFIEQDETSIQHRSSIANWIKKNAVTRILDYGGGFGTLARLIAENSRDLVINIYEPYPSELAVAKIKAYPNIHFVSSLVEKYDCLVSTDVIEHVDDPLGLFAEMIEAVNLGGFLIIGSCFYPVIKCHLPTTFHLRDTLDRFAQTMGLEVIGLCEGSHYIIYKKVSEHPPNWAKIRILEIMSKSLFLLREKPWGRRLFRQLKNLIKRRN